MASKFGGIPIDDTDVSKFGGIAVEPEEPVMAGTPEAIEQEPGIAERAGRQAGLGLRMLAEGAAGLAGIAVDPVSTLVNQFMPEEHKIGRLKEDVAYLLTQAGVPNPESATERIVQQAGEALVGGAGTIGAARGAAQIAAKPLSQQIAKMLAAQPLQQLTGALGAGAGQQAAQEAGAGPVAQLGAGLAAGMVGAGIPGFKPTPRTVQPGLEEAEQFGITAMTSDVLPPRTFAGKAVQAAGEKIPIMGTGPLRAKQYTERVDAIKNVLRRYDVDEAVDMSEDIMRELSKQRKADLSKYTGMKRSVINKMDRKGVVPVPKTISKIDEEIARLKGISEEINAPAIKILEQYKTDFQNKTFDNIDEVRKLLGEAFTPSDLATVKKTAEKSVNRIYGAVKEDLGNFIKQKGDKRDYTKWRVADKRLSSMINELETTGLKAALKKGEMTPEQVDTLLFSKKPSEIRLLYKNLTPEGRANARTAILRKALDKSNGMENISAEKFKSQLNKLGNSIGIFFKDDELRQMHGLARALKLTEQSARAGLHPPTGVQTVPYIGGALLADLFGTAGGAIAGAAGIGALARTIESKPVRDALIKLPSLKKGSPEEAEAVKRVIALMQTHYEEKTK